MLIQDIREAIRSALLEIADSNAYEKYAGACSERLEQALVQRLAVQHCLLASSGTAALEIALRAAGVGPGDEVIVSAYDYPGNFWAVERVGARPRLIDTEPGGWRLATEQVHAALQARDGCRALVASHLHGQLQDAVQLRRWCDDHDLVFIEDCCQAMGACIGDQRVGTFGHAAIVSFGGGKQLSAGRGGALLTSEAGLYQRARIAAGAGSGPYALSEVQAAIVLAQLPWMEQSNKQSCRFFSEVDRHLQEMLADSAISLEMPARKLVDDNLAGIYQAGWLITSAGGQRQVTAHRDARSSHASASDDLREYLLGYFARNPDPRFTLGKGFAGFHRRSSRRCTAALPLVNVPSIAATTLVIHRRVALEEQISSEELSRLLVRVLIAN